MAKRTFFTSFAYSMFTSFHHSADLPMNLDDRVAAVGIATKFQEKSKEVYTVVEEETEYARTQVLFSWFWFWFFLLRFQITIEELVMEQNHK